MQSIFASQSNSNIKFRKEKEVVAEKILQTKSSHAQIEYTNKKINKFFGKGQKSMKIRKTVAYKPTRRLIIYTSIRDEMFKHLEFRDFELTYLT